MNADLDLHHKHIRSSAGSRLGQVICRRRESLSQGGLARAVGISQSQLSRIENGRSTVTLDLLEEIAAVLNTTIADLCREAGL